MKKIPAKYATTPLERHVRRWLNDADGYDNGAEGRYTDLMDGGCQAGTVWHLIYTVDCVRFYKRHAKEIDRMLADTCSDLGEQPSALFKRIGWDDEDPLAREGNNQHILAWFGFEETARRIYEMAEQDQD